jgi:hypothetical protein
MNLFPKIALASVILAAATHPALAAYDDVGTDYTNFKTNAWVDSGPAGDSLRMVDFLLCVMDKTKIGDHPNTTYSVLVDEADCFNESAETPQIAHQTVTTLRATAADPYTMKGWFVTADGMKVVATTSITSGSTVATPMGVFSMTWKAVWPTNKVGSKGSLKFNKNGTMSYIENMTQDAGDNNSFGYIHGALADDGTTSSGQLRVQAMDYSTGTSKSYRYVFDGTHLHLDIDGATPMCFDRSVTNTRTYGYQLFTDAGVKKDFSGSFGFKYTIGEVEYSGYAHPDGAWLEKSHVSGAFDKPAVITRRSDNQTFNICYDDTWDMGLSPQIFGDDGDDDNVAGQDTSSCGTAGDNIRIALTYATDNAADSKSANDAFVFAPELVFNNVSFTDTFLNAAQANIGPGRYNGSGSSMDLGWQCVNQGSNTWVDEVHNSDGSSTCENAYNYRPKYSLPDGIAFVETSTDDIYRIKTMDSEIITVADSDTTSCADLPLGNAPGDEGYTASSIPDVSILWSELPTVSAANTIKYIHGVAQ